jgi:ATP-dependent RNA helicase HelY
VTTTGASPSERYAAFRRRAAEERSAFGSFRKLYEFGLDDFQAEACQAVESGESVLVAAPTGAGKTVVGEFAVHLALEGGTKCFYTTPIKALSNQKYNDLVQRYGADNVGLLTGDNTVNGEAPVVVMTTEVLRNMLYAGSSTLGGLAYVVMDEVHYLSDRFRGAVWEEVIIHLPEHVALIALSATVSNAEEFGDWIGTVRGTTRVVVEERRPVPLWQHVMAGDRLYDLFVDDDQQVVSPELVRLARDDERFARTTRDDRRPGRGGRRPRNALQTSRPDVVERLDREGLLPAINFIFSRVGCDAAVAQCLRSGLRLTTPEERAIIRELAEERCAKIPDEDLVVLGYDEWLEGLVRGIAAHHAGMLPTFKEVVEELFTQGLVKVVFATETLALGINMPARSVVLERLVKWNGETHADVTPGEYTQLTGRAGRRGIDVEGHAVVVWHQGLDPRSLAGLASTRTYPLRSSFSPSYNMAVNLVGQVGRDSSRAMLETSFAQFQADRAVVGLAKQVRKNEEALDGYREAMTCHLGDFEEYASLRRQLSDREAELARSGAAQRRAQAEASLERLRVGDVIHVPAGRRAGLAVVLDPGRPSSGNEGPRPVVLTADKQVKRLTVVDFPTPVEALERIRIPKSFNQRSPQARKDLASTLRNLSDRVSPERARRGRSQAADDVEIARLRKALRQHPCHGCDEREDHARWAERYHRLVRENQNLERRVASRTHTISRTFDRVCGLLESLGYLDGDVVTDDGRRLARIYSELDLLTAECLRDGVWRGLTAAELAACASLLCFESRQSDDAGAPKVPGGAAKDAIADMVRIWGRLDALEKDHQLSFQREPDLGFAWVAYRWASGHGLQSVLRDSDIAAGDFVRWCKQLVDVLGQIADAASGGPDGAGADPELRATARKAVDACMRGVVSFTSVA